VHPDVAQCDLLECMGNYFEGMEGMFFQDHYCIVGGLVGTYRFFLLT
jgi:hypothetical protein